MCARGQREHALASRQRAANREPCGSVPLAQHPALTLALDGVESALRSLPFPALVAIEGILAQQHAGRTRTLDEHAHDDAVVQLDAPEVADARALAEGVRIGLEEPLQELRIEVLDLSLEDPEAAMHAIADRGAQDQQAHAGREPASRHARDQRPGDDRGRREVEPLLDPASGARGDEGHGGEGEGCVDPALCGCAGLGGAQCRHERGERDCSTREERGGGERQEAERQPSQPELEQGAAPRASCPGSRPPPESRSRSPTGRALRP